MRTAILSLFTVAALVVSTRPAEALPPRYFSNNNGGYGNQPVGPYYYSYSGAPIYNQNYIYPGYAYPYYYFNGTGASNGNGNYHYGLTGRGGGMHPAPMSWHYNGYGAWNGRP